ncbi:MAG: tRNA (adenosine(37)-N6)-threonylcarbamoyltransferase complex transferase subunit TsaD [Acidobacteriota bacterium]|nr:tRNA (adenosine(37)-N6)-threonylcarbamoyltransferase complex transferase subunit TsaD [Acidobacteriota bacterium]MDQ7088468.1 tRNA (adenosine(37)-N6)-threonylcarbamoyltransferase complex transferase subunit TsaD [Acidobacteriota bacterium]
MRVLAVESSCDETAAAVADGRRLLSSVVSSQVALHAPYGGVVPEIAARHHLGRIRTVVDRALAEADTDLESIEGLAVTRGPGLVGCLLVGVNFVRALALTRHLPVVGVNHLEGHIASGWLEAPLLPFPALALVVSGGHTALWRVRAFGAYQQLARTRDDAAGEAFDKAAKMMGLPYPGGPAIDRLAARGDPQAFHFGEIRIKDGAAFSFSGYKTAVREHMSRAGITPLPHPEADPPQTMIDLVASFRYAVVRELVRRTRQALRADRPRSLVLAGGVAANRLLRQEITRLADEHSLALAIPPLKYCGDNAAMIARAGIEVLETGANHIEELDASASLPLGGEEARRSSRRHR